ncbi:MAG: hypothetical protein Q9212_003262 [Teloschistes hypoglaucus]
MARFASIFGFLLSLAVLPFSSALKFDIQAHTGHGNKYERCIRNFVAKDTLVLVTAIVSGQKGDGQMVSMHIKDAVGNEYGRPKDIAGETRMAFTSHADAAFDVCFENQLVTTQTVMNPTRHIELDIDIGADARDWSAIQAQEKLKPVETELRRVEELVSEIVSEMDYLRTREQKLRDTNESTNERVKWFAFGTMGMLVGLGAWQVIYLRAYFSSSDMHKTCLQSLMVILRFLTPRMVILFTGPARIPYYVRADLLSGRSAFFKAAPDGCFREGVTLKMDFPEADERAVKLFRVWLHDNQVDTIPIGTDKSRDSLEACVHLHCFAQMYLLEELANLSADRIRQHYFLRALRESGRVVTADEITLVYDHHHPVSPKLQSCFCYATALEAHHSRSEEAIDPDMSELLQLGGEFPDHLARLLVVSAKSPLKSSTEVFSPQYNCLFHYHREVRLCSRRYINPEGAEEILKAMRLLE